MYQRIIFEGAEQLLCNIPSFGLLVAVLALAALKTKNLLAAEFSLPYNVEIMKIFQKGQILHFDL